jgi:rhodanese-related sulfurtransferase
MTMMDAATIDRAELRGALARGQVKLVMAMDDWAYANAHIPGSLNSPTVDDALARLAPGDAIVVYATGPTCPRGLALARQLIRHGYRQVRHFAGGLEDWTAAGLPLASGLKDWAAVGLPAASAQAA